MLTIMKKELSEKWTFALYGSVVLLIFYFNIYDGLHGFEAARLQMGRMVLSEPLFLQVLQTGHGETIMLFSYYGFFIGCMSMFSERKQKTWVFVVHREKKVTTLLFGKLLLGSVLYLVPVLSFILAQILWVDLDAMVLYSLEWTTLVIFFKPVLYGWVVFLAGFATFIPSIPSAFRALCVIGLYCLYSLISLGLHQFSIENQVVGSLKFFLPVILFMYLIFKTVRARKPLNAAWLFLISSVLVEVIMSLNASSWLGFRALGTQKTEAINSSYYNNRYFFYSQEGELIERMGSSEEGFQYMDLRTGELKGPDPIEKCQTTAFLHPYVHFKFVPNTEISPIFFGTWAKSHAKVNLLTSQCVFVITDSNGIREGYVGRNGLQSRKEDCDPFPKVKFALNLGSYCFLQTDATSFLWLDPRKAPLDIGPFQLKACSNSESPVFLFDGERIAKVQDKDPQVEFFSAPSELKNAKVLTLMETDKGIGIITTNHPFNQDVPHSKTSVFTALLQKDVTQNFKAFIEIGENLNTHSTGLWLAISPFYDFLSGPFASRVNGNSPDANFMTLNDWRFWTIMLAKHLFFAILFLWVRVQTESSMRRIALEFLGIVALGLMFLVSIWLLHLIKGRVRCPICKTRRTLDGLICPTCKVAWPLPESRPVELVNAHG